MVKYIKCINDECVEHHVTLGKTYKVIDDYLDMYILISDKDMEDSLYKHRFVEVNTQKTHELWT